MKMCTTIIYDASGSAGDRIVRQDPAGELTIALLGKGESAEATARELLKQGARRIELCGGMPAAERAKVIALADGRASVSGVTFGIESIVPVAAYNAAYLEGHPPKEAMIILQPGADPAGDRITRDLPPQHITIVFVPDEASAPKIAATLVEGGVRLIELYGGFTTSGAAAVIAAADGKAAIGVGSFAIGDEANSVI
ncbi:DUF6506 family protein [Marilutibacter alkalisoli]|uniref:Uncharacterized protein n=1 Tax=Marilutibacter alkalisoli TaxID=2591633 RepID=A0A514BMY4_9GAMM|nr:DUF6506 family protein [Lysobacter alkalisoli]QDH68731.1 hypothetical protein FKV23_00325 [Lysobacter alkalisoli]